MISRLVADKGVREFVTAARLVKKERPEVTFELVGPKDPNPAAIPPKLIPDAVKEDVIDYSGETRDVRPSLAPPLVYVLPSYPGGDAPHRS